ncbi:MAG: CYTH domain-containing protein, partial [Sarcina sp.]
FAYINRDIILSLIDKCSKEEFEENLNLLIESYDSRNFIEIERKFLIDDNLSLEDILNTIKNFRENVEISSSTIKEFTDIYYDYKEYFLKNKFTLRFRNDFKNNKKSVTFKKPTNTNSVTERFEYKFDISEFNKEAIAQKLESLVKKSYVEKVSESLVIESVKNKFIININDIEYELSYDDITHKANGKEIKKEKELELELKSNYYHKANLKAISDYLCEKLSGLTITDMSKYQRGMSYKKATEKYDDLLDI